MINKHNDYFQIGMYVKRIDGGPMECILKKTFHYGKIVSFVHWDTQDLNWAVVEVNSGRRYQLLDDLQSLTDRDAHLLMKLVD